LTFINNLKPEDHQRLRHSVRQIHFQYFDEKHGASFVSNSMLDNVIESLGEKVAQQLLKQAVDNDRV
tara:strand:- start:526 stop:726 length:201 start_codon:yes stop_codon:yes gene_type:complete